MSSSLREIASDICCTFLVARAEHHCAKRASIYMKGPELVKKIHDSLVTDTGTQNRRLLHKPY